MGNTYNVTDLIHLLYFGKGKIVSTLIAIYGTPSHGSLETSAFDS